VRSLIRGAERFEPRRKEYPPVHPFCFANDGN
jgi:hypothetical protein